MQLNQAQDEIENIDLQRVCRARFRTRLRSGVAGRSFAAAFLGILGHKPLGFGDNCGQVVPGEPMRAQQFAQLPIRALGFISVWRPQQPEKVVNAETELGRRQVH